MRSCWNVNVKIETFRSTFIMPLHFDLLFFLFMFFLHIRRPLLQTRADNWRDLCLSAWSIYNSSGMMLDVHTVKKPEQHTHNHHPLCQDEKCSIHHHIGRKSKRKSLHFCHFYLYKKFLFLVLVPTRFAAAILIRSRRGQSTNLEVWGHFFSVHDHSSIGIYWKIWAQSISQL